VPTEGLSYKQASKLTDAMMKDLGGVQNTMTKSSSISSGLTILATILGTIIAALAAFVDTLNLIRFTQILNAVESEYCTTNIFTGLFSCGFPRLFTRRMEPEQNGE